jgi:glycosyltransferase involved in cell wall biosynthesis
MVLIPAYNEEGAVASVVEEVRGVVSDAAILVVDDCSEDDTIREARRSGASVLPLPYHLGLGGCVQAGYRLAFELGFDYVIRVDGDGQHDPKDIPAILAALQREGCEMVIGSRFLEGGDGRNSRVRSGWFQALGITIFRFILRPILGRFVSDPTSGFVGVNRDALNLFSRTFPLEYPEIEALVVLQRGRFRFIEVPCRIRARRAGRSSISAVKALYFPVHVLLGVFVNILLFPGSRAWWIWRK